MLRFGDCRGGCDEPNSCRPSLVLGVVPMAFHSKSWRSGCSSPPSWRGRRGPSTTTTNLIFSSCRHNRRVRCFSRPCRARRHRSLPHSRSPWRATGTRHQFGRLMSAYVGAARTFTSASLWELNGSGLHQVAAVAEAPQFATPAQARLSIELARRSPTFTVGKVFRAP